LLNKRKVDILSGLMKKDIHPQIFTEAVVTCACGNSFVTMSTKKELSVEICSACHPFFTGKKRYIDTEGQIDKFAKRLEKVQSAKDATKGKKTKGEKEADKQSKKPLTLKDLREMSKSE
jgi:large subunit ribosomal protein L31